MSNIDTDGVGDDEQRQFRQHFRMLLLNLRFGERHRHFRGIRGEVMKTVR